MTTTDKIAAAREVRAWIPEKREGAGEEVVRDVILRLGEVVNTISDRLPSDISTATEDWVSAPHLIAGVPVSGLCLPD